MDKETPVFVYCQSGARADRAVAAMKRMKYKKVKNIGGISNYDGGLAF